MGDMCECAPNETIKDGPDQHHRLIAERSVVQSTERYHRHDDTEREKVTNDRKGLGEIEHPGQPGGYDCDAKRNDEPRSPAFFHYRKPVDVI